MSQYWFKAKEYGWGFGAPLVWQGWAALMVLIALVIAAAYVDGLLDRSTATAQGNILFVAHAVSFSMIFCLILRNKVEGGLKWRWGKGSK